MGAGQAYSGVTRGEEARIARNSFESGQIAEKMIGDDTLIGHSREDGAIQSLEVHLRGVARLAEKFARPFSAAGWAAVAGLLHDDGKALAAFQTRIRNLMEDKSAPRVDHSTPGAKYAAEEICDPPAARGRGL